ncbi:MAG: hypothetical protein M3Y65_01265 [Pseudomonadota bacterium]|nr:hypothetical protein [Pseudomonadota bacterium]
MPNFRVWYRDNPEPLEFATAYRASERQIVEQILAHEKIALDEEGTAGTTVAALIAANSLAPVRYTEDESEINVIA